MATGSALAGAGTGATLGAAFGPVGIGVGALAGGLAGALTKTPAPAGGSGGGGVPLSPQNTDQNTKIDLSVENNLIGAPININIGGGTQQADGSLGAGQKYNDRGVDEPRVNAPFGTMQDVSSSALNQPVNWNEWFLPKQEPAKVGGAKKLIWWIGGGVILAGAGLALVTRRA